MKIKDNKHTCLSLTDYNVIQSEYNHDYICLTIRLVDINLAS